MTYRLVHGSDSIAPGPTSASLTLRTNATDVTSRPVPPTLPHMVRNQATKIAELTIRRPPAGQYVP
eukprot:5457124-Prymnesium_polylepis.1